MPFEIIRPGTHIDFIGKRKLCAALSLGMIALSLLAIPIRGVRFGIDFAGGNEVQVRFDAGVEVDEGRIRAAIAGMPEIEDPSVVRFGSSAENEFLVRFGGADEAVAVPEDTADPAASGSGSTDRVGLLEKALRSEIGAVTVQRVEFVGPGVGADLQRDGVLALVWASLAVLVYIAFRFSWRYAPGAVLALVHDLSVTAGVFVLLGIEFDLRVLAAMLAILGYSLNDTIIVYDRIRENVAVHTKRALPDVLNLSINETLSRTLLTSGTTLVAVAALYTLGGEVIRPFAFAMMIGIAVGTYSSIFVASPLLLLLEQRERGKKSTA